VTLIAALGPSVSTVVFQLDPAHLPPLELTLEDIRQILSRSTTQQATTAAAMKLIPEAARLDLADLLVLVEHMHTEAGLPRVFTRKWEQAVKEQHDRLNADKQAQAAALLAELVAQKQMDIPSWPYTSDVGHLYFNTVSARSGTIISTPIADFTAQITETIQPENGNPIHRVTGVTFTGKPLEIEIGADEFQDTKILTAALSIATARDPRAGIHVGMGQHLPMAIRRLTPLEVPITALYRRTGWADSKFLLPGRSFPGIRLDLISDLPYEIASNADLKKGTDALMSLIQSVGPQNSLPALMTFFAAPLAHLLGLRDERYVTMIRGRTGKFKTSWAQTAMCLYGPGFAAERHLIKWGDGATTNAIEALASFSHDMPFLMDNYKPNTGEGERGLIKLIHRMAEGSGRRRLDRNAMLRPTPELYSWLIMTGEDTPQNDIATSARMLLISFDDQPADAAQRLSHAQANSEHLCAVGRRWIEWLESPDSIDIVQEWRKKFAPTRQYYLDLLLKTNPDAINGNPRRIAQNLAVNCLTWEILRRCPDIGPYFNLQEAYPAGLRSITQAMATATVQSNPGLVFINALRELLASERALLLDSDKSAKDVTGAKNTSAAGENAGETNNGDTARRMIGYTAADGGAYLLPELARSAVDSLLGKEALAQASSTALYKRLDELGYLSSKGKDGTLIFKKINGKSKRVLHLNQAAIEPLLD